MCYTFLASRARANYAEKRTGLKPGDYERKYSLYALAIPFNCAPG